MEIAFFKDLENEHRVFACRGASALDGFFMADIEDNMDVRRLDTLDDKAVSRMKRYHDA